MNNPYAAPDAVLTESAVEERASQPKIFALNGRIGRLRYLGYGWLFAVLAIVPVAMLQLLFKPANFVTTFLVWSPFHVAAVIAARRRLQDLDNSGWLALLILVPLLNALVGLYLVFSPGTRGENRYGFEPAPNPRGLWLAAAIFPMIAIIGIIAAIALPAYQQYTLRAKAAAAAQQQP